MTSKSVFLSAGHSDTDPGATVRGYSPNWGTVLRKEADIAVEFRNMVSFYLTRSGVEHALDGHGTTNLPLSQAAQMARKYDLALEFHCNAAANSSATGVECLSSPSDAGLAGEVSAAVAQALGIKNRGAKPGNAGQHSRLAFVQAGGVIVELFFLSNPKDLDKYDTRKWLAAKAVADVIIQHV